MESILSNMHENSDIRHETHSKKRPRLHTVDRDTTTTTITTTSQKYWKSPLEQQTYSCKLLHALRHLRNQNTFSPAPQRSREVREEADKVLAIVARGRTRWSRAILAKRMKLRLKKHKKAKVIKSKSSVSATCSSRLSGAGVREISDKLPDVDKRVKVLGRLVPGCRKVSFPNLLEEAIDYISAVQMQVRAMTALTEMLTATQISSNNNSSEPGSIG